MTEHWPIQPDWSHGLPHCTEQCGSHDGKRCQVLGRRPESLCEPAVGKLVEERAVQQGMGPDAPALDAMDELAHQVYANLERDNHLTFLTYGGDRRDILLVIRRAIVAAQVPLLRRVEELEQALHDFDPAADGEREPAATGGRPAPCPFCGVDPELRVMGPGEPGEQRDQDGNGGHAWGFVRCRNPRCPAQPSVDPGVPVADDRGVAAYNQASIQRWNHRPAPRKAGG